jgi:two-component system sensor histidine kinase CpxA
MRGLFFKIFIIFWIAQSLIYVISVALIVRRHFESPDAMFDLANGTLQSDASKAAEAYESGGCQAVLRFGAGVNQKIALKDSVGNDLCNSTGLQPAPGSTANPARISGGQSGEEYVWRVPVTSAAGSQYLFLLSRAHTPRTPNLYQDLLRFSFPQLPVAIVVVGLTTFVLVLLFTRPVARLRKAARELASGKLGTRVAVPPAQSRPSSGDELVALMHDFNYMAERLESLVDAQKLLLRDVSHELRSPLSRLSVALELAREDAEPAMTAHLERIQREAERLNLLIGQLLSLSSMEALDRMEKFKPLLLNSMIARLIPDAEFEAEQRECSVVFHADGDFWVRGNEDLLYRAVENVVRNAIRYTKEGSDVDIQLSNVDGRGAGKVRIDVSDRGPGIPADQREAIFRPFYRVDSARSPETGGFGVGLAIAERAIRVHKGEMSAMARDGGGTIICITLPSNENGAATAANGDGHK